MTATAEPKRRALTRMHHAGDGSIRHRLAVDWIIGALAILVLVAPLPFTRSDLFPDFTNSVWLVDVARNALTQAGYPTYFLNASTADVVLKTGNAGVFVPYFAFYGGPLYMLTGGLAILLLNHVLLAYYVAAITAAVGCYGGVLWLGRQVGLHRLLSHVPALCAITSAYYMTDLYGRAAWAEFIATSVLPPLVASALWLARNPRWRVWPVICLIASAIIFSGSHNITLLWGTISVVAGLVVIWLSQCAPRNLPWRRIAAVIALIVLAAGANAWFLLPDVKFAGLTRASQFFGGGTQLHEFSTLGILFNPGRHVPPGISDSTSMQLPVWFLAWSIVAVAVLAWRANATLRRAALALVVFTAAIVFLVVNQSVWSLMPKSLTVIQFSWRLLTYADYAITGLVAVALLILQNRERQPTRSAASRFLRPTLIAVCAISIGLTIWQGWVPTTAITTTVVTVPDHVITPKSPYLAPPSWYDPGIYNDASARVVAVRYHRKLTIPPSEVIGGKFSGWVKAPRGTGPIATNISAGPYLINITGVRRIGRTHLGYAVVERKHPGARRIHITISTVNTWPIVAGRVLSVISLLAIVAILLTIALYRRRHPTNTTEAPGIHLREVP